MEFGLLGSLLVRDETGTYVVSAAKQRILLAALLLRPGQVVTVDVLAETIWDGRPPKTATASVRNYVMRLRNVLGPAGERISSRPGGYLAEIDAGELDLLRFEQLRTRGAQALQDGSVEQAASLLGEAVALWRGPALADVPSDTLHRDQSPRLAESRLGALELKLEAESRLGRYGQVIAELQGLTAMHPERERLWVQLMTALYRSGRQSEALAAYRRIHQILDDEVGVEPGPELRELHRRILAADPVLDRVGPQVGSGSGASNRSDERGLTQSVARSALELVAETPAELLPGAVTKAVTQTSPGRTAGRIMQSSADVSAEPLAEPSDASAADRVPADTMPHPTGALSATPPISLAVTPFQVPADLADFTGRACETDDLIARLTAAGTAAVRSESPAAASTTVLTGPPGIGKTALAIRLAHAVRPRFPDGTLYADLRGTGRTPALARTVLASFLRALGVAAEEIPPGLDDRAALFRSVLADRRVLIVLDDVADSAQVVPLLPGTAASATLITSQRRLTDLGAAYHEELDVLTPREAAHLLGRIVGQARTQAEPTAVAEVAAACGRLPLALRIAGARLAARPRWQVRDLADRLAVEDRRLDELATGTLDLRSRLLLGYRALTPAVARAFRVVSLLDVPILRTEVAAAALDESPAQAEKLLEDLVDAHLLGSSEPGCYSYLALIRTFARELAHDIDHEAERAQAIDRATRALMAHDAPTLPPAYASNVMRVDINRAQGALGSPGPTMPSGAGYGPAGVGLVGADLSRLLPW